MTIENIESILPPSIAIIIAVATFVFTQVREQHIEERSAARSTLEILVIQNKLLIADIADMRQRPTDMTHARDECETQLLAVTEHLTTLEH